MDVLVVRHGAALDREDALAQGMGDRARPLTPKGKKETKRVGRALARKAPDVAALFTSPLLRAVETAEILSKAYDGLGYTETEALVPEADPAETARFLAEHGTAPVVAVVGHEPHLGHFLGWALTGEARSLVELEKSGAALVRFDGVPAAGAGRLVWLVPPTMLRKRRARG
jgi:phosphohistidine phosphatase